MILAHLFLQRLPSFRVQIPRPFIPIPIKFSGLVSIGCLTVRFDWSSEKVLLIKQIKLYGSVTP